MSRSPEDNLKALREHLNVLKIGRGMDLAVHSRLISFGRIAGGVDAVYDCLRAAVGPDATLVFPTYTLGLASDDIYDPTETPAMGMGALSDYVRTLPDAVRTLCPMHGHIAIGPKAEDLSVCDPSRSLGPGSSFDWMHKEKFALLLLGCTAHEGATFIHHVEAMVGVPYRSWIDVPRRVRYPDGTVERMNCRYYGRARDTTSKNDLDRAERAIRTTPACRVVSVGPRDSILVPLAAVDSAVRRLLSEDAFALTKSETVEA